MFNVSFTLIFISFVITILTIIKNEFILWHKQ